MKAGGMQSLAHCLTFGDRSIALSLLDAGESETLAGHLAAVLPALHSVVRASARLHAMSPDDPETPGVLAGLQTAAELVSGLALALTEEQAGVARSVPLRPLNTAAKRALMTVPEYAGHRGCSDSYVRRMRRAGRVVLSADGLIDVAASDALLNSRAGKSNVPVSQSQTDAVAAAARQASAGK